MFYCCRIVLLFYNRQLIIYFCTIKLMKYNSYTYCGSNNILIIHEEGEKYLHNVFHSVLFLLGVEPAELRGARRMPIYLLTRGRD